MNTCTGPDCDREIWSRTHQLCNAHNTQRIRGRQLTAITVGKPAVPCAGPECTRTGTASAGLCRAHLDQRRRDGGTGELRPLLEHRASTGPKRIRKPRTRTAATPRPKQSGNLPASWFVPSIKKPSNPAGVQRLAANQVGLPVGVTDGMRRTALRVTALRARSRDERVTLLDMIFDINPNQKAV